MTGWYLVAWWISVAAAVCAVIALPFLYRKGKRQLDDINWRLDMDADARESVTNCRRLRADELHRRVMRKDQP